jgi:hypothetical protein
MIATLAHHLIGDQASERISRIGYLEDITITIDQKTGNALINFRDRTYIP